jgi:uncharacterized HAD superfamily protein
MKYITLSDLSNTIRNNIWKIPRDIDFIIGVPRSGMIAASIISSYLNVPLIDVNSFVYGLKPYGGNRLKYFGSNHKKKNKVLVIDDTVFAGTSMNYTREKLKNINDLTFVYMCVYLEGIGEKSVDLYLEDLRQYTNNFTSVVIYEWNIFQHNEKHMINCLYDIDGVLCVDPPDERKENEYIEYIKNAKPLFIPRTKIGGIITFRLEKNRDITEKWLHDNGISYNELIMFDAMSWDERNNKNIPPEKYKADFYKQNNNYKLFVESNDYQAKRISEISGKPVYCVETNKLYQ